jgi:hypothetical protein
MSLGHGDQGTGIADFCALHAQVALNRCIRAPGQGHGLFRTGFHACLTAGAQIRVYDVGAVFHTDGFGGTNIRTITALVTQLRRKPTGDRELRLYFNSRFFGVLFFEMVDSAYLLTQFTPGALIFLHGNSHLGPFSILPRRIRPMTGGIEISISQWIEKIKKETFLIILSKLKK